MIIDNLQAIINIAMLISFIGVIREFNRINKELKWIRETWLKQIKLNDDIVKMLK